MISISDWEDLSTSEIRARLVNRGHDLDKVNSLLNSRYNSTTKLLINRLMNTRGD